MVRAGRLKHLLATAAPRKSKLERDLRRLLHEHGLPQPISNGFVCGYEGDDRRAIQAPARASASCSVSTSATAETGSSA